MERSERLSRLILRGVYLYAQRQGWLDKDLNRVPLEPGCPGVSPVAPGFEKMPVGQCEPS